jgi:hypothetical protein
MHVKSIADQFGGDFLRLKNRAGEAGTPVSKRRHAIEQVRRMPRAGFNRGERRIVVGSRVSE